VNALGHSPPEVVGAMLRQAEALVNVGPAYHTAPAGELATALARECGMARVFLCSSGAEANEGAIKLARKWGRLHREGAHEIVTTVGAFHGRTLAAMAASGKAGWDAMFPPCMPGFVKVPFGDAGAVDRAIGAHTVAVMVEPIQGEAGVVVPPPGYLQALREITRKRGVLLVFDEVQTGMGRTGTFLASQAEGVLPDILTLGKGIGGGLPLAALLATEDAACFAHGEQGGTYSGNPVTAAVALAVLEVVSAPRFLASVRERGAELRAGLERLGPSRGIGLVRGQGLLVAAKLVAPLAESVRDRAFEAGLLLNAPRPDLLRFMPSLRVTAEEVGEMLAVLASVLEAVFADARSSGS
jgi:acetylornithine/N-succinyldiaminopimelate aminotransferase